MACMGRDGLQLGLGSIERPETAAGKIIEESSNRSISISLDFSREIIFG